VEEFNVDWSVGEPPYRDVIYLAHSEKFGFGLMAWDSTPDMWGVTWWRGNTTNHDSGAFFPIGIQWTRLAAPSHEEGE